MARYGSETESDAVQMQRMLLWFRAQLPSHELGHWQFQRQPHATVLVNDESRFASIPVGGQVGGFGDALLVGSGSCIRCGKQFKLAHIGNHSLYPEEEQDRLSEEFPTLTTPAKIEEAKEWLRRDAERDGECWGDVPRVPDQSRSRVVLS